MGLIMPYRLIFSLCVFLFEAASVVASPQVSITTSAPTLRAGEQATVIMTVSQPVTSPAVAVAPVAVVELGGAFYFWPFFTRDLPTLAYDRIGSGHELSYELLNTTIPMSLDVAVTLEWYGAVVMEDGTVSAIAQANQTWEPNDFSHLTRNTNARFDLSTKDSDFYAIPFPSALRQFFTGAVQLSSFPNPSGNSFMRMFMTAAMDSRDGWHLNPLCLFHFDGDMGPNPFGASGETLDARNGKVAFIDIDSDSPDYGKLFHLKTYTWTRGDTYQPGNLVVVAPFFGDTLREDTTYAAVIYRGIRDASLQEIGTSPALQRALHGLHRNGDERDAAEAFEPLAAYLKAQGTDFDDVVAATVFTTGTPSEQFHELYEEAVDNFWPTVDTPFAVTEVFSDYYVLEGALWMPQFIRGEQPYNSGGTIAVTNTGELQEQSRMSVPVVVTIPRVTMPEDGFPLMFYIHGSGGVSRQSVDRGKLPENEPGEGPARYYSRAGVATVSMAMPINPERYEDAWAFSYFNFVNVIATRGMFRQGTMELGLLRKWMDINGIDATLVPDAAAANRPQVVFNPKAYFATGQSMGAMYTTFFAAMEPSLKAIVPTGAGGFWSLMLSYITEFPGTLALNVLLGVGNPDLNEFHPVNTIGQMALEHVDPVAMAPRVVQRPFPGHEPKHVFYPAGYLDAYFHPPVITAYTLAMGMDVVGPLVDPEMATALAMHGRYHRSYPVMQNRWFNGNGYTAVVNQFAEDGIRHGHYISFQLDEPKFQYRCFVESFLRSNVPTLHAPLGLDAACP